MIYKNIYRITHYRNLEFIIKNGIYCRSSEFYDPDYINIGNNDIISKRCSKKVPVEPFGTLGDYIPFYFVPKSPMLFSIYRNNVSGFSGSQNDIVIWSARQND